MMTVACIVPMYQLENGLSKEQESNLSRRNPRILLNKRSRTNHAVLLNNHSVKQSGTHTNKSFILNDACM